MKRNKFSLSHYRLMSSNFGNLVPIGLYEVLPGDTIQQATQALVRLSPLVAPVMHPVHVRIHHYYVPFRLIWEDWENFITGGEDNNDTSVFPTRTFAGGGPNVGSLADYLGCPPGADVVCSALPFRAYSLIWNEFYRDQDLQTALVVSKAAGADSTTNTTMQNVAWEKDYFTSSRPWAEKGPSISVPLQGEAPVLGIGMQNATFGGGAQSVFETGGSGSTPYASTKLIQGGAANTNVYVEQDPNNAGFPGIFADITGASVDIRDMREAFALQRFAEARARYGSRYVEYLRYLGVRSSDARLQRPEYLGGGRQTLQFSEVLQTAEGTSPVGEMRGHGISSMRSNRFRRFIEEHGYVMSLMSIRPKTIYQQGLPRHWNRRIKEDFFQKELVGIGQQEVLNKEIYTPSGLPDGVFGFQDRYDDYRRVESTVTGEFRTILDFWHQSRIFSGTPALNASFVNCEPDPRIFAVESNDTVYAMVRHSIQARRIVPRSGGQSFIR